MPLLVSEIEAALATYKHPEVSFYGVLNEVLPRMAQLGIWKDLTYEESQILDEDQSFYSIPEGAESVLYVLTNNSPTPVSPLWQDYRTLGATSGRPGADYGFIDAGYGATKEVLDADEVYGLFAFPAHNWGDVTQFDSVTALTGKEVVKVRYTNWEGFDKESVDTLAATANGQALSAFGVKNISSIEVENVTVPVQIVAMSPQTLGHIANNSPPGDYKAHTLTISADNDFVYDSAYSYKDVIIVNPAAGDPGDISFTYVSPTSMTATSTNAITLDYPVMLYGVDSHISSSRTKGLVATGYTTSFRELARVSRGYGAVRYRRFRIGNNGNNFHALYRRKITKIAAGDDLVYIDDIAALKMAIMAHTAEYNNDRNAAKSLWEDVKQILDDDLAESLGAATPTINIQPFGGQPGVPALQ